MNGEAFVPLTRPPQTFYVTIVFYNAALAGIKMTFLFQYYRVLAVQKMKKVFIVAMIIVGAWSVSQILIAIFNCSPIPAFWDKSIDGSCIPNYPYFYINAAGNIATDIIVFVLPLPVINKLSLARGQKYVLLGIFCLGFLYVGTLFRASWTSYTDAGFQQHMHYFLHPDQLPQAPRGLYVVERRDGRVVCR